MNAKYTPGPWKFVGLQIELEDGSIYPPHIIGGSRDLQICSFFPSESDSMAKSVTDVRSKRANARLICAAPELLFALQECCDALAMAVPGSLIEAHARSVIAKANGDV